MNGEPKRLVDLREPPSPDTAFTGRLIRAHQAARPPAGKMDELAGRLGPLLEGKSASPARVTPWLGISVVAAVLVAGAVFTTQLKEHGATGSAVMAPESSPVPSAPPAVLDAPPAVPDAPPAISVDALPNAGVRLAPAAAAPRCNELELIDRADTKLRSGDLTGALAVARDHEQRCPSGLLVQERERIAIEALAKLGRVDAARARARTFEERFPASPHLRRVRQVIDGLSR
ncbi:MAG: hypothetical protein BGO98_27035 [Myxococcales bacterium 68-20]|nr:hypothetical protein [Myxococcales bacterium]OJY30382.1 MAG: hypothetical protein BGO98_27035 [Myxococcales bacterium 68-20]